jgi:chloramphenicol-sensitive protein RarD
LSKAPRPSPSASAPSSARQGVVYGLLAYTFWGCVPVYFRAVSAVAPLEVLAHRVVWSAVFLLLFTWARGRGRDLRAALADRRTVLTLTATTVLIAANWYTFIWTVTTRQILQSSLGYYINPLVSVLLGFLFLGERLRPAQRAAVALAAAAVLYLGISYRQVPHLALVLAFSFGVYGLLRKRARADALIGLTVETLLLLPVALAFLLWRQGAGELAFGHGAARLGLSAGRAAGLDALLVAAGLVTAVPLLWYANAVRRLRLATIGFLQYISPSLQFLLAVAAYGEKFGSANAVAFAGIWSALALYSWDTVMATRREAILASTAGRSLC